MDLSNTVVRTYQSPSHPTNYGTPYRASVGGGALFNADGKPVTLADVSDGAGNSILYIHAANEVPWAKPEELI